MNDADTAAGIDLPANEPGIADNLNAMIQHVVLEVEEKARRAESTYLLDFARSAATNVPYNVEAHIKMLEAEAKADTNVVRHMFGASGASDASSA